MSDPPSGPASPPAFKGNDRPFRLALRVFGVLLLLFGIAVTRRLFGIPLAVAPSPGSYALSFLIEVAGLAIVLAAPIAARQKVGAMAVSEAGVTGPGFLRPVFIPWSEVVLVCDDERGVLVQSARQSARIDFYSASYGFGAGPVGGGRPVENFQDPEGVVRFILSHAPKGAMLDLHHWMPA